MAGIKEDTPYLLKPEHLYVAAADIVRGNLWTLFPVINIDRVADLPCDWPGLMGVPITFLDKYDPDQFVIIECRGHLRLENGRAPYQRIIIRNLHPVLPEKVDLVELFAKFGQTVEVECCEPDNIPGDATALYRAAARKEERKVPDTFTRAQVRQLLLDALEYGGDLHDYIGDRICHDCWAKDGAPCRDDGPCKYIPWTDEKLVDWLLARLSQT